MRVLSLALGWLLAAHAVARAVLGPRRMKVTVRLDGREIARSVNRKST